MYYSLDENMSQLYTRLLVLGCNRLEIMYTKNISERKLNVLCTCLPVYTFRATNK